ncbi:MAG: hypothetical protein WC498_03645 [Candidatus Saccharimonadales bacterium]
MTDVKKEWYKHGWGLVVAILFFPYFLIWYAWAKSNWSKNLKIGLTSIIAIIMIPFTIAAATTKPADTNNQQNNLTTQEQSESETQKELEAKKAAELAAQEEAEKKAVEEAAQKKAEEEAAAVAAAKAKAEEATNTNNTSQVAAPTVTEDPNLPLKAICNDGTVSYQDTPSKPDYRGMCSGHDGIRTKLGRTL